MWQSARASTGSDRSRLQPPLLVSDARSAQILLSSSKPTSQVARNGCRLPVIVMSWVRFSRSSTGRPVMVAPSAAMAASPCGWNSLPPKPPPIRRHWTVMLCAGMPSTCETMSWVSDGCWVLDWMKIWPFSSTRARAALRLQVEVLLTTELELPGERPCCRRESDPPHLRARPCGDVLDSSRPRSLRAR